MSLIFGDKLNNENNLFGLHIDYSSNNISNFEPSNALNSFNLGLSFTHRWENRIEMNLGMLAKYGRGAKGLTAYELEDNSLNSIFSGTEVERKIKYLSLPVTIRYRSQKWLFVEAGPQISYRLKSAYDYFEADTPDGKLELEVDVRDQIKKMDFSAIFGAGTYFGKDKVNAIGIRYHAGLTDILKDIEGKQHYSQWALYANLPIGRGKAGL
ncbi:porin family protein [Algoriphagus sp.]|uniref:porin family protein n=1 Tax=Algoriphagus sp. TaxID=1872435 RepID=UPI0025E3DDA2|nr:porin family protein [Algoriphagus sp.]